MTTYNQLISIIIVNYNGKKWLKNCLDSLYSQTFTNFEIIIVDNASSDESVNFIKNNYPKVKIIENKNNDGFAKGNNDGLAIVTGQYIFLLNNDTFVKKDCLENLLEAFIAIPNLGAVQPKLILMDKPCKLDCCGSYWTDTGLLYHYGIQQDAEKAKYNQAMPFFSNKGAAMMIQKNIIDKIGLFDDDFWCYYEETDFCNRLWMAGYECWYYPKAVCYHAMGGTSLTFPNSYIQYHNLKNKPMSFIKNFEFLTLLHIFPVFIFLNTFLSFYWLAQKKPKHFLTFYKAIWWNIANLKRNIEKRKIIQKQRKVSDKDIFQKVKRNPGLKYYISATKTL